MAGDFAKLKESILADGKIDAEEVAKLREELYADGVIDRAEADLLFELNDATQGKDNAPEWEKFFVSALVKHLLGDPNSPGTVDAEEAAWLKARIGADGKVDGAEKKLLEALKEKTTLPSELTELM